MDTVQKKSFVNHRVIYFVFIPCRPRRLSAKHAYNMHSERVIIQSQL